jgi:hypothetical protein
MVFETMEETLQKLSAIANLKRNANSQHKLRLGFDLFPEILIPKTLLCP